jgi:DNA invertase Pin-like site-specific DNA recombinase
MLSVMGAFAEFERALTRQRGVYRGRKKALDPEQAAELRRRAEAGEKKARLAREFVVNRETVYPCLKAT